MSVFSRRGASMCVCWCLCVFERSSYKGLVQPGCQKNGISSLEGLNKEFRHRAPTKCSGQGHKGHKNRLPITHTAGVRVYSCLCLSACEVQNILLLGSHVTCFRGLLSQCAGFYRNKHLKERS